jgi:hypothetical protein
MKNGEDIKQAQTLPNLAPRGTLALWGAIHSYSFSVRVLKDESNSVKNYAVINFSGELEHPREWHGLEVKGYVSCYSAINEDDMRFKDGDIALGTIHFLPASDGDEAYLELEQLATLEFFRETKQLLQSSNGKPNFHITLTNHLESFNARQRFNELSIGFPELRTMA